MLETDVLVVGAGPVGLALAGDLGWRGQKCLVIEQGDGSIYQPKMDLVGIRTMEFCRRWGIVHDVENAPYPRDYPQDNVYLTGFNGYELGRERMPAMGAQRPPLVSPQKRERCPQNMFDPILRKFALSHPTVEIMYHRRLIGFGQDDNGVHAQVADTVSGTTQQVLAKYIVGCDGARTTSRLVIRKAILLPVKNRILFTGSNNCQA